MRILCQRSHTLTRALANMGECLMSCLCGGCMMVRGLAMMLTLRGEHPRAHRQSSETSHSTQFAWRDTQLELQFRSERSSPAAQCGAPIKATAEEVYIGSHG